MRTGSSMPDPKTKHFLETSVVRGLLVGASRYKAYLQGIFADRPQYISRYVAMEFMRRLIVTLISFYFTLLDDNMPTYADALSLWSERFQQREVKTVLS